MLSSINLFFIFARVTRRCRRSIWLTRHTLAPAWRMPILVRIEHIDVRREAARPPLSSTRLPPYDERRRRRHALEFQARRVYAEEVSCLLHGGWLQGVQCMLHLSFVCPSLSCPGLSCHYELQVQCCERNARGIQEHGLEHWLAQHTALLKRERHHRLHDGVSCGGRHNKADWW